MSYQQLYDLSLSIKRLLDPENYKDRVSQIDELHVLLNEREVLLRKLPEATVASDRALCQKVIDLNQEINIRLNSVKANLISDMNAFRHRKKSVNRYRHPYQGPTKDGMFLDRRE